VFDEAHEYLSDAFGEKLESRIRQMRHEGTSYVFATQDVGSIPKDVQRFMSTKFVFGLGSRQNVDDLLEFSPEFRGFDPLEVAPGTCFVQATISSRNFFANPKLVRVRPRATAHGGSTRIFS
jgi:DNA helicase HerA-like ATPase